MNYIQDPTAMRTKFPCSNNSGEDIVGDVLVSWYMINSRALAFGRLVISKDINLRVCSQLLAMARYLLRLAIASFAQAQLCPR